MDDVILNKAAAIERCLHRVREVYAGDDRNLREDLTRQAAIVLNRQRACEAAIDMVMHLSASTALGSRRTAARHSTCWSAPVSWAVTKRETK
jgi:GAF domain-containing protein